MTAVLDKALIRALAAERQARLRAEQRVRLLAAEVRRLRIALAVVRRRPDGPPADG